MKFRNRRWDRPTASLIAALILLSGCGGSGSSLDATAGVATNPTTPLRSWEKVTLPKVTNDSGSAYASTCRGAIEVARTAFNGPPGAFVSSDQGSTWTRRDALFYSLPIPGSSTVRLLYRPSFSGTSHDVDMLSDDCGASSRELPQSYYACKGVPIQVDSVGRSFLVQSAVNGAVCRSDDAGSSWTQAAAIPDGIKLFGRRGAVLFGYTPATAGFNLVSSSDGGSTWTPSGLQYGIWSVDGFNGDTTVPAYTIAQASNSAELKLWRYDDQAGSWSAVDATLPPGYSLKSMHIAVSPSQHQRLVATTDQAGLLESLDGGKTWKAFAPGVPAGFAFQPFFDPLKPSVLYWAPPGDSSWRIDTER